MTCAVVKRRHLQRVRNIVETRATVAEADILDPTDDATGRWALDIALDDRADGADAGLCSTLGYHGLSIRDVSPQGAGWRVLATL